MRQLAVIVILTAGAAGCTIGDAAPLEDGIHACAGDPWLTGSPAFAPDAMCGATPRLRLLDAPEAMFQQEGARVLLSVAVRDAPPGPAEDLSMGYYFDPRLTVVEQPGPSPDKPVPGETYEFSARVKAHEPGSYIIRGFAAYTLADGTTDSGSRSTTLLGVRGNSQDAELFKPAGLSPDAHVQLAWGSPGERVAIVITTASSLPTAFLSRMSVNPNFQLTPHEVRTQGEVPPASEAQFELTAQAIQPGKYSVLLVETTFEPHVSPVRLENRLGIEVFPDGSLHPYHDIAE